MWKFAGNGRIARANAYSFARLQDVHINNIPQTNYIDTGLQFEIQAPTAAGLASISATVPPNAGYYAIVTGALGTALYVSEFRQSGNSFFAAAGDQTTYAGSATPRLNNFGHNQYPLSDQAIALLGDSEVYSIAIYQDNASPTIPGDDVPLATYSSNAGKRPYLRTELTVASFAAITAPTKAALTVFANAGGTIPVTWTLPQGKNSSELHYFRSGTSGFDSVNVDLTSTQINANLTIIPLSQASIGTLQANGNNLSIQDSFGRPGVVNEL